MSTWFATTNTLTHVSPLPIGITRETAIRTLQNHVYFMKCDPHMIRYEATGPPVDAQIALPESCSNSVVGEPAYYLVTDKVQKLPAGLWESDVISIYEFINLERGLFVRLRSPLNVMMDTIWEILEGENGGLILVEIAIIKTSKLLVGLVSGMSESSWQDIHGRMIRVMGGEEP